MLPVPLRVVYLCEHPTLLGGERSLLEFLRHCGSARIEAFVVAPGAGRLADALAATDAVHVPWPDRPRRITTALVERLAESRVDLVHANSLSTAEAALELGKRLSKPSLAHVRDMMRMSAAQCARLRQHGGVVVVSDAVARWLVESGLPQSLVHRVYNAVDGAALRRAARPGDLRRELGIGDTPLIVCIGQIALRKGQDLLLEAAARLAEKLPTLRLVFAGERYSKKPESATYERRLRERAQAPPLAGRVCWLGYREDVPTLLADADLVVVPSRQEPLSRTLLEALALGTPAVATSVGGSAEILADGVFGLVVSPEPAPLAGAICRLLHDTELRKRLAAAGPRYVRENFSAERQITQLRALYDDVCWRGVDEVKAQTATPRGV